MAAALEETEKSVLLASFKAISLCTLFALQRFSQDNETINNGAN
jgi:hypothetical protein